jgi:hypothetical protein
MNVLKKGKVEKLLGIKKSQDEVNVLTYRGHGFLHFHQLAQLQKQADSHQQTFIMISEAASSNDDVSSA